MLTFEGAVQHIVVLAIAHIVVLSVIQFIKLGICASCCTAFCAVQGVASSLVALFPCFLASAAFQQVNMPGDLIGICPDTC